MRPSKHIHYASKTNYNSIHPTNKGERRGKFQQN